MEQILTMAGKAKQVFKYLELVSQYKGYTTLKELMGDQYFPNQRIPH
jgi:hypothetical protein